MEECCGPELSYRKPLLPEHAEPVSSYVHMDTNNRGYTSDKKSPFFFLSVVVTDNSTYWELDKYFQSTKSEETSQRLWPLLARQFAFRNVKVYLQFSRRMLHLRRGKPN